MKHPVGRSRDRLVEKGGWGLTSEQGHSYEIDACSVQWKEVGGEIQTDPCRTQVLAKDII